MQSTFNFELMAKTRPLERNISKFIKVLAKVHQNIWWGHHHVPAVSFYSVSCWEMLCESLINLYDVDHRGPLLNIYANKAGPPSYYCMSWEMLACLQFYLWRKQSMDGCWLVAFVSIRYANALCLSLCVFSLHAFIEIVHSFVCTPSLMLSVCASAVGR